MRFTPLSIFFRHLCTYSFVYRFNSSIIFSYYFFVGREALDIQRKKTKERKGNKEDKTTVEHRLRLDRFKRAHFRSKRREENCSIQAQARIRVLNVYEYESSFNKFKPPETNLNKRERKGKQRKKKEGNREEKRVYEAR